MSKFPSIFNDVIGPVMVGPSSSHTAASVRIGYFIRALTNEQPEEIVFEFSGRGSLAACHEEQGTDMGLAAGILGMAVDDDRLYRAVTIAAEQGVSIKYLITDAPAEHPNTYTFTARGGGREVKGEMISLGGGMIKMSSLAGIPVSLDGGYFETILLLGRSGAAAAAERAALLRRELPEADEIIVADNKDGDCLIDIRSQERLDPARLAAAGCVDIITFAPVLPIRSHQRESVPFLYAAQIGAAAAEENLPLWKLAARYEMARGQISEEEVLAKMAGLLRIILRTIDKAGTAQKDFPDRILGPQAHLLAGAEKQIPNPALNKAIEKITYIMEAKSSFEVVVAAPTAGSCGCLPGTIIGVAESLGKNEDDMVKAMLAAGLIGVLIAAHGSFAAEVGGCAAECGSGSGMAAAGLVQLMGGTAEQALTAASMALQNICGMVCDPVALRVEVPCLGKNILGGGNAIAMANLAMAGFDAVIPLDETIDAMRQIGSLIDPSLRCTGLGGLSATPSSQQVLRRLQQGRGKR